MTPNLQQRKRAAPSTAASGDDDRGAPPPPSKRAKLDTVADPVVALAQAARDVLNHMRIMLGTMERQGRSRRRVCA